MRLDVHGHSINQVTSPKNSDNQKIIKQPAVEESNTSFGDNKQEFSHDKLQKAVDSVNELLEINNRELKFVFHEGLEKYYVQLVDSKTEEVVREIPSKKLLDVFYEMQKLAGMIVDEKI